MKRLFTKRRLMFIGIIVVMIFAAGILQPKILSMREEGLIDFAPPGELRQIVLFTQAIGAFRSIAIDVLWIRAMDLQNEKKFFELAQLYDLICKFEPHFTEIWIYSAWNMAYNISVELPNAEDRWSWVQKGISQLRDQAIRLNPREAELYKELSWIYLHKIGDDLDNKHRYYKREMVLGFDRLLGPEQDIEGISKAPDSKEELLKDKSVDQLVEQLSAEGADLFTANLMMPNAFNEKQLEILAAPENAGQSKALLNYLRKQYLITKLNLDPAKMLNMNKKYGRLDWRLPEVHGLYWAELSIPLLKYDAAKNPLFYYRYIHTAFNLMFRRGKIEIRTGEHTDVYFSPDIRWADKLNEIYLHIIDVLKDETDKFSMQNAYKNWLKSAVYFLNIYGEKEKSREFYKKYIIAMRKYSPGVNVEDVPFEVFVLKLAMENLPSDSIYLNKANIKALIMQALLAKQSGNDDEAANYESLANYLYEVYRKENAGYEERFSIGEYKDIYDEAVKQFREDMGITEPEKKPEENK